MTNPYTPEQIREIVEWWESGNEPREPDMLRPCPDYVEPTPCGRERLNPAGITIARLAIALREACEVAADVSTQQTPGTCPDVRRMIRELNQTRRELLGE